MKNGSSLKFLLIISSFFLSLMNILKFFNNTLFVISNIHFIFLIPIILEFTFYVFQAHLFYQVNLKTNFLAKTLNLKSFIKIPMYCFNFFC